MALTRLQFDRAVKQLLAVPHNGHPNYNEVALACGISVPSVMGIWRGSIPRPRKPGPKVKVADVPAPRELQCGGVAIAAQKLKRGPARKCIECNRLFTLLFTSGMCQECRIATERSLKREYA